MASLNSGCKPVFSGSKFSFPFLYNNIKLNINTHAKNVAIGRVQMFSSGNTKVSNGTANKAGILARNSRDIMTASYAPLSFHLKEILFLDHNSYHFCASMLLDLCYHESFGCFKYQYQHFFANQFSAYALIIV